jgi:hypothetical protein
MEIPEVRRRLRAAIELARTRAQESRARSDQAAREYDQFLRDRAVPLVQTFAAALAAEGYRFRVFTPAGAVRLAAESSGEDFIELTLDSSSDPPAVLGRSSRGRGRRAVTSERVLNEGTAISQLTDEDVLAFLIQEITPLVGR